MYSYELVDSIYSVLLKNKFINVRSVDVPKMDEEFSTKGKTSNFKIDNYLTPSRRSKKTFIYDDLRELLVNWFKYFINVSKYDINFVDKEKISSDEWENYEIKFGNKFINLFACLFEVDLHHLKLSEKGTDEDINTKKQVLIKIFDSTLSTYRHYNCVEIGTIATIINGILSEYLFERYFEDCNLIYSKFSGWEIVSYQQIYTKTLSYHFNIEETEFIYVELKKELLFCMDLIDNIFNAKTYKNIKDKYGEFNIKIYKDINKLCWKIEVLLEILIQRTSKYNKSLFIRKIYYLGNDELNNFPFERMRTKNNTNFGFEDNIHFPKENEIYGRTYIPFLMYVIVSNSKLFQDCINFTNILLGKLNELRCKAKEFSYNEYLMYSQVCNDFENSLLQLNRYASFQYLINKDLLE